MILNTVISALAQPRSNPRASCGQTRKVRTVAKVVDLIKQCPQNNPTITEICEYTHTSRRALQYAFNDVLGVSPGQYLRAARLNSVRRALVANTNLAPSEREPISTIAQNWGFWHLGQFAQDYRRLFAELPSQTGLAIGA
jgi:AraC family ethanolamine operon transcriptional activator